MTSEGPIVGVPHCHAEGGGLSLNWIDFSFLYAKDTLVHIEAVYRAVQAFLD